MKIKFYIFWKYKYLGKQVVCDTPRSAQVNKCLKNTPAAESLKKKCKSMQCVYKYTQIKAMETSGPKAIELKCYI